jgi:hypothetical protein
MAAGATEAMPFKADHPGMLRIRRKTFQVGRKWLVRIHFLTTFRTTEVGIFLFTANNNLLAVIKRVFRHEDIVKDILTFCIILNSVISKGHFLLPRYGFVAYILEELMSFFNSQMSSSPQISVKNQKLKSAFSFWPMAYSLGDSSVLKLLI